MGKQIIKQPNGLYAIFSSVVDDFTQTDCTPEDIIDLFIGSQAAQIRQEVLDIIAELESGGKPYMQHTQTYEEAVSWRNIVHNHEDEE